MRYLLFIFLFSFSYLQTFDPVTGELIQTERDSSTVKFNSIPGEVSGSNKNLYQSSDLNIYEIKTMARTDVIKYFDDEMMTYRILGGTTSLVSIFPSAGVGMLFAYLLGGDELAFIGWLGGFGLAVYGVPRLISQLDSEKNILLELDHIQSLSPEQKTIYFSEFIKELHKKRVEEIYKGERNIVLISVGIPILLSILFNGYIQYDHLTT